MLEKSSLYKNSLRKFSAVVQYCLCLLEQARRADPEFKDPITLILTDKQKKNEIMRKNAVVLPEPEESRYEQESLFTESKDLTPEQKTIREMVDRIRKNKGMGEGE